ncbi:hypothetical protein [Cellulomonas carbonis]|uniref:SHOCT domain-containing protein n=1 Tax=Cellulomonas carbonis T26 TaxID=947969 RepID=A0A0A0BUA5_9CELL|nr:hypothetical protein [Cellulomonas carbonis]KGM11565.1 hypothetical protein N868_05400 [Cellulomonas carbonis T26]GGC06707.1 hypothetical protein GCM10010972_19940 [Cellulomonas carbonis]
MVRSVLLSADRLSTVLAIQDGFGPDVEPGLDPGLGPTVPGQESFEAMFSLVMVLVVVGVVVSVVVAVRRGARYLHHGIDPTTVDVDLQARLLRSQALAPAPDVAPGAVPDAAAASPAPPAPPGAPPGAPPARSVAERLAELDRLREDGTITAEEHTAARLRVIADV